MKRLPLPDLLKGFAVFLIIPVHILEVFTDYAGRESVLGKIILFLDGPFIVPVFMTVMGYFAAKSQKPFKQNFIRGIKVFILGFLLNIGLNLNLLLHIKFAGWKINPLEYIFGVDILYFAGISLIFLSFLKIIKKGRWWIALVMGFLVILFTSTMNTKLMVTERNYILPFIAGTYSWSYFPLFPWLVYPLIGFAFFHFEEKILTSFKQKKWITGFVVAGIAAVILFFSKWGVKTTINLSEYYHHTFWFSLWAFGVIILWSLFLRFIAYKIPENPVIVFFQWLGKNITLFYVIQWLIIGNIGTTIYQTQSIDRFIFWFSGIFTGTVLITWLLEKTHLKLAR